MERRNFWVKVICFSIRRDTQNSQNPGAFVSDSEVSDVVDFIKNQMMGNNYSTSVEEQIKTMQGFSRSSQFFQFCRWT